MPSAVTEAETWEANVIAPVGSDVMNATGIRDMAQDLANRTKWLKGAAGAGFIEYQDGALSVDGDSYSVNTTFTGSPITLADVKIGDLVIFVFQLALRRTAGTGVVAGLHVWNASDSLVVSDAVNFAFNDSVTQIPGTLIAPFVATVDASSMTFQPRITVGGTTPTVIVDDGTFFAVRFKRGA